MMNRREGSNFVGTEEDLQNAMRENLSKFYKDYSWLVFAEDECKTEQEIINIEESLAECILRDYIKEKISISYLPRVKRISFSMSKVNDEKGLELTELGKMFLGLEE